MTMIKHHWFRFKLWFFRFTSLEFTSDIWQKVFPEIKVLDPDGWDRSPDNFGFDWYIRPMNVEEYMARVTKSTIKADVAIWK